MKYTFKVVGKIKGKSRPRFNTKTGRTYKVNQDRVYEAQIRTAFIDGGFNKSDKYIRLELDMFFQVPKSYNKKRRFNCLSNIEKPAKKPDIDNVLKNILDSLNGYAYNDDIQVIEVVCKKYYTEEEDYVMITIKEI